MRWIYRILGVIVGLVILAVAALFLLPTDRIANLAEERFEAATGRALTIDGGVRPSLWPNLGARTGPISISAPDGTPFLSAEALSIGVDWQAALGGDIRIRQITLDAPDVTIRPGAAPSGGGAPGAAGGGTVRAFSIDAATVRKGKVTILGADGRATRITDLDATFALPDFAGTATLSGTGRINGQPAELRATAASFAGLLGGGSDGVEATFGAGDLKVGFTGRAGLDPLRATGRLDGRLGALSGLSAIAGIQRPDLPPGLGRDGISIIADADITPAAAALSGAELKLDQNVLSGDLEIALDGPRPQVTGALTAGALDFSGLGGGAGDAGSGGGSSGGWSTDPIDVSGLGALDMNLDLVAGSIALSKSSLGATNLNLALDDRRLVTTIRRLVAYDGTVTGAVVLNGRGVLSASADLTGSAIAISRLFAELLDFDRLIALGDMDIYVIGVGNSMHALMNSLDGEGSFRFGAGELLGLDLVGMLRNLDPSYVGQGSRTIFDEITGTFRIVDGVVINENLRLLAPLLTATGRGEVGIGAQTLNYRLVPKLLDGDGAGISVPVLITGTWDAPRFRLDLEGLVDEKARAEIEAAKDRAEQKLKEKVTERLGAEAGPSLEESLKDKAEEKLKDNLLKLLGR